MAAPLLPEFLGILGVDIFLVLSILACVFDFPTFLQYLYHISAYVGFLQLWVNYVFAFSEETRFFICLAYLLIGLANVIFVNGFIGFRDRKTLWTISLLCCVTIPFTLIGFSATSLYVNRALISLPVLPMVSAEGIAAILVICGIVLAISLMFSMLGIKLPSSSAPKRRKGGERINENKRR
jgi:hypothetical protein